MILKPQSDIGESLRDRQTFLFHPAAGKAYPTTLPVDCEAFRPLNLALLSKPSDSASPDLPPDVSESTPGQTILSFQVHARQGLPVRHGSSETTVGRRREPPSQTILLFQVLSSARLTRPTRQLLKPPSDVGESLPARQTHPFRLLTPRYRTPRSNHAAPPSAGRAHPSQCGEPSLGLG